MAKLKRILIVLLVVVLLAGVGVFLYFYFTQGGSPPVVGGNSLSLCLNGTKIENGGSLGLLDSGQEFTVENAEKYDVQIYAYCTQESELIVLGNSAFFSYCDVGQIIIFVYGLIRIFSVTSVIGYFSVNGTCICHTGNFYP